MSDKKDRALELLQSLVGESSSEDEGSIAIFRDSFNVPMGRQRQVTRIGAGGAGIAMPELQRAPSYAATNARHPSQDKRFMESYSKRKNVLRHNEAMMDWGKNQAMLGTRERGQDVTARGQDLGYNLKQDDLNLDRTAWNFGMQRYDEFGRSRDKNALLRDKIATIMQSQDFSDMDDDAINSLLGRFRGLFSFGKEEGVAGPNSTITPDFGPGPNPNTITGAPSTYPGPDEPVMNYPRFSEIAKIFGGKKPPMMPMPESSITMPQGREESWLERTFPWAKGYRGTNTPSWW